MRRERGQSLVELGVSFLILMYLLSGAVEFGIAFFQSVQLKDAAAEGAIFASMFPYDTVSIEERVRYASQSPIDLQDPAVIIFVSYPDGSLCEGKAITVNVLYPHKVFMPFIPQLIGQDSIMLRAEVTDTILSQSCNVQ
jgi:hypothetical protein